MQNPSTHILLTHTSPLVGVPLVIRRGLSLVMSTLHGVTGERKSDGENWTSIAAVMKQTRCLAVEYKIKTCRLMSSWYSRCSHTPLQCFPSFIFSPSIPHTCTKPNGVTTHHTHSLHYTHTHTSSPSVCAAARVSGTGSSWEQREWKRKCLLALWSWIPLPVFFTLLRCCLSRALTTSRRLPLGPPRYRNTYPWCHLETNQILSEAMEVVRSVISVSSFQLSSLTPGCTFPL